MAAEVGDETMQESWVDVQKNPVGGMGSLTHTSSKEELQQLLASAASEEELSDGDLVYQVKFKTAGDDSQEGEEDEGEEQRTQVSPSFKHVQYQVQNIPVPSESPLLTSSRTVRDGIFSLSLLVPVLILTHLAMFGIGYLIGRRCATDTSSAVMRVFHV